MSDTIVTNITAGHTTITRQGAIVVAQVWIEIGHQRYVFDDFDHAYQFGAFISHLVEKERLIAESRT